MSEKNLKDFQVADKVFLFTNNKVRNKRFDKSGFQSGKMKGRTTSNKELEDLLSL